MLFARLSPMRDQSFHFSKLVKVLDLVVTTTREFVSVSFAFFSIFLYLFVIFLFSVFVAAAARYVYFISIDIN